MKQQFCYNQLALQVLDEFIRHRQLGIPVGIFSCFHHIHAGHIVSALFTGNSGEIDVMFGMLGIDHDYMNQILVDSCIQTLHADGAEKVDTLSFPESEVRVFQTCIIFNIRM